MNPFSPKRFAKSLNYALQGIKTVVQDEPNFTIHLVAMVLVCSAGWYFAIESWEWVAISLTIGIVLSAEAFNTSLENLTDLASPDIHPLAKKAKDTAAAAVLITGLMAIAIACFIFIPKILSKF